MVTALYCRKDSIYKEIGLDVYDIERDATTWAGGNTCIAHPPCRAWGRLKGQANINEQEKMLAVKAVQQVIRNGGVLEHPAHSSLWKYCNLPLPGQTCEHGFSISIDQSWFGHPARKNTWLFISGTTLLQLPLIPIKFDCVTKTIEKHCSKKWREATLINLAYWLNIVAASCKK